MASRRMLSRDEARAVYDRIGSHQDTQSVYEASALEALVARGEFEDAHALFEVGCGTGRFAAHLLRDHCPPSARYTGVDLSATMVAHARNALAPFAHRATVVHTDGTLRFDQLGGTCDRVIAAYVLDLLAGDDVATFLDEVHRLLAPGGRLCVAGLTWGRGLFRVSSLLWDAVHVVAPRLVGGCRPMTVHTHLDPDRWHVRHATTVTGFGIPSEVLVAEAVATG